MKINKDIVAEFEHDQKHYGTKTALHNFLFAYLAKSLTKLAGPVRIIVK